MNRHDSHQIVVGVSKVLVHERYDQDTTENDITLLKLATPVTLNDYVNIVCLPKRTVSSGQHCYITGFGDTMGNINIFQFILDGGLYTTYLYKYIEMVTYEGGMGHIKIKKTNISIFFLSQNVTYKCVVQWVRALIMHYSICTVDKL